MIWFPFLNLAGSSLTRSSVNKFLATETPTIEVGKGNLKLTFSVDQEKNTNYANSRSLVRNVHQRFLINAFDN